jgi:hypothetical protein
MKARDIRERWVRLTLWRRKRPSPAIDLVDVGAVHRAHPRTFSIPRRVVREHLKTGDLVKLSFVIDPPVGTCDVERMWVEVVEIDGYRYRGRLDDNSVHPKYLQPGISIGFGPEHVAARHTVPDDGLFTDPAQFAVVSRLVWDEGRWPGRVERRSVPDPTFSGWFVFEGSEGPEYLADPMNFLPVPAANLFVRYRVLDSALEGPLGSRLAWSETNAEYQDAE